METNSIVDFERRDGISDGLTDLLRKGAQRSIEKTGATILMHGPQRPRGERSYPRHCP